MYKNKIIVDYGENSLLYDLNNKTFNICHKITEKLNIQILKPKLVLHS